MNAFMLTCLVAVASAVPQGYNYPRPTGFGGVGHSSGSFTPNYQQHFGSVGSSSSGHGFGAVSAPSFSHGGAQHSNSGGFPSFANNGGSHGNTGGFHAGGQSYSQGGASHGNFGGSSHGSSYQGGAVSHGGFSSGRSSGFSSTGFGNSGFGGSSIGGSGFGGSGFGRSGFGGSAHGGVGFSGSTSGGSGFSGHQSHAHQEPIVTKHFYLHAAPEETEEEVQHQTISTGPARKNYRVVFIKAPTQSTKAAALTLKQAQNEDKTVIYVLSKKMDASEVQAAIQAAPTEASKPEVFFIKYKTNEEAAHAQHTIQSQYDALGGSTHISDEGLAPVQSVIGVLGQSSDSGHGHGGSVGSFGGHQHFSAPSSTYIPSN